jgi:antitoxin (DNA-binding transcriptional repressor) of toxin-antitoxin stability system
VTVVEAKERIAQLIDRVASGRERIVIERDGRVIGALVNRRDLALIVEDEEDREDIAAAEQAAHEEGAVSWEKIKADADL